MNIIVDIKHHLEDRFKERDAEVNLAEDEVLLPGGVIDPDVLWSCTTCRACMEVCPSGMSISLTSSTCVAISP